MMREQIAELRAETREQNAETRGMMREMHAALLTQMAVMRADLIEANVRTAERSADRADEQIGDDAKSNDVARAPRHRASGWRTSLRSSRS